MTTVHDPLITITISKEFSKRPTLTYSVEFRGEEGSNTCGGTSWVNNREYQSKLGTTGTPVDGVSSLSSNNFDI